MVCLSIPSEDDIHFGKIIKRANELDVDSVSRQNMIVFSTFNLLRLVHMAHEWFDDNMMACIDSSHGGDASGGKLMSFGYVSMKWNGCGREYRRKYYTLVFARVVEECQAAALLMLAALGAAVHGLFDVRLDVKGGLISDHANSFVNAFLLFFIDRLIGRCFPHISLKVNDQAGLRKRGTLGYLKYVRDWLNLDLIHLDVIRMHECTTALMKTKFVQLCLTFWREVLKEVQLANTFKQSYLLSEPHSHFRFNEFKNPGDIPQCNSIERFHLTAKGSKQFEGYCNFGLGLDQMMQLELPKLVSILSMTVGDIERAMRLLDQVACEEDSQLMENTSKMGESDWLVGGDGSYFCNNVGFTAYPLDKGRIKMWTSLRNGVFDPTKRLEFWEAGISVCYLQQVKRPTDKRPYWECSCVKFWKKTSCCHSYIRQYSGVVMLSKGVKRRIQDRKRRREEAKLNKEDREVLSNRYPFKSGFDLEDADGVVEKSGVDEGNEQAQSVEEKSSART